MLVDAENAFNNLNRNAALKNMKELCAPFYQYLYNTYQSPVRLVIPGKQKYDIYADEGCTQCDVASMAKYGISTKALLMTSWLIQSIQISVSRYGMLMTALQLDRSQK